MKINENIAIFRKAKGITQEELAVAIGVTNQSVSKWESGQCCPDIQLLPVLATFFDVSIDELMGYEPVKSNEPPRTDIQMINNSIDNYFAPLISASLNILREEGTISTSILQRKLRIGYGKAAFIINKLSEQGYININQNGMHTPTDKVFK
ncbi:MAG: helix-turn-helix domain-containing protein [Clostridia bacterium]|nr:helix-turn-helix domain-containing protein [Clostridia bacterium]